jgi:hypothetical protein
MVEVYTGRGVGKPEYIFIDEDAVSIHFENNKVIRYKIKE